MPIQHANGNYPKTDYAFVCHKRQMLLILLHPIRERFHYAHSLDSIWYIVLVVQMPCYLRTQNMVRQNRVSHRLTWQCPYAQWMERTMLTLVLASIRYKLDIYLRLHWLPIQAHPMMSHSKWQTLFLSDYWIKSVDGTNYCTLKKKEISSMKINKY